MFSQLKRPCYIQYIFLIFIILFHLLLLTKTVFWFGVEFRLYPYLTSIGALPYKDIIDQHFPGIFFFPLNLYTLGLATPLGLRSIQIFLVIVTHILLFFSAKKITQSTQKALITNLLYVPLQIFYEGYVVWIDSFLPPLLLLTYVLIQNNEDSGKKIWQYTLSGFFIGFACIFKQTAILLFLAIFFYISLYTTKKLRNLLLFSAGFMVPLCLLLGYILHLHVWQDFFDQTIIFNFTIYPSFGSRLPTLKEIILIGLLLIPFASISLQRIFFSQYKKDTLLIFFILPLIFFVYGRYDFVHLQPVIPFIILAAIVEARKQYMLFGYILLYFFITTIQISKLGKPVPLANYDAANHEIIAAVNKINPHSFIYIDTVFRLELYQLLGSVPPQKLFVNYANYASWDKTTLLKNRLLQSLISEKPDIIIRKHKNPFTSDVGTYIENNYVLKQTVADADILVKK